MEELKIDTEYLKETLVSLLNIHSPSGFSDQIVHYVGKSLQRMGAVFNVTRRGAIRCTLKGASGKLDRALVAHLDTLGAMVSGLKENGRCTISPIGTWSSRFAEGARVTIYSDSGPHRGTVLPLKASGHIYGEAVDCQPSGWDHVEIRVDRNCRSMDDLLKIGIAVGDIIAFDAVPEMAQTGFINARHLDDKAGVAILLSTAQAILEQGVTLPTDCHLIFTIFEEVGSGASAAVYSDVAEIVTVDHAPIGPGQNASETGVTVCMMDQTGPFDYHLSRKLCRLCEQGGIRYKRDVFQFYRSDSASAIEAGNDIRTALVGFGVDASHGHERTHINSLVSVAKLLGRYLQSEPTFARDKDPLTSLNGFPHQPARDVIQLET